jgi:hypothetical protein
MSISHTGMVYFGTEAKPYKEPEVVKDTIVESVVNRFKERSEVGIAKYGTTMDRKDLSTLEWMIHFREELMDGLLYLERVIKDTQKENIIDIMKSDEELGLYANTFSGTTSSITNGTTGTISTTTTHYDTK